MIYVDIIREYPALRGHRLWCHMISDLSDAELHAAAQSIGMKRAWFQEASGRRSGHYDLVPSRRVAAIKNGAIEVVDACRFATIIYDRFMRDNPDIVAPRPKWMLDKRDN